MATRRQIAWRKKFAKLFGRKKSKTRTSNIKKWHSENMYVGIRKGYQRKSLVKYARGQDRIQAAIRKGYTGARLQKVINENKIWEEKLN